MFVSIVQLNVMYCIVFQYIVLRYIPMFCVVGNLCIPYFIVRHCTIRHCMYRYTTQSIFIVLNLIVRDHTSVELNNSNVRIKRTYVLLEL